MVGGTIEIDWCEIVFWPMGSYMDPHFDGASADTVFTSITYLNNNFIGGNLYIENDGGFCVKTGRTLSFDGQHYKHGVSQVLSGERYTMPIWYKKKG